MKRDLFTLPLALPGELIINHFASGGGTSNRLEAAFGRPVDMAIDHDPEALAMHVVTALRCLVDAMRLFRNEHALERLEALRSTDGYIALCDAHAFLEDGAPTSEAGVGVKDAVRDRQWFANGLPMICRGIEYKDKASLDVAIRAALAQGRKTS